MRVYRIWRDYKMPKPRELQGFDLVDFGLFINSGPARNYMLAGYEWVARNRC